MESNLFNPKPSFQWDLLDLKEVEDITNIKLSYEWKYYFTNFHRAQVNKHKDDCRYLDFWKPDKCNCNIELVEKTVAILKAGITNVYTSGRGQYYFVNIPASNEIPIEQLAIPESRTREVLEALTNGLETLVVFLKVFEVTGKTFDYGPPLTIYNTEGKHIYGREEIDGDILYNILYDKVEPKLIEASK